jgi:hypothetical protein
MILVVSLPNFSVFTCSGYVCRRISRERPYFYCGFYKKIVLAMEVLMKGKNVPRGVYRRCAETEGSGCVVTKHFYGVGFGRFVSKSK